MFEIESPEPEKAQGAVSMCVGGAFVWALMPSGKVFVRGGIYENCPQGIKWSPLDLTQLGTSELSESHALLSLMSVHAYFN